MQYEVIFFEKIGNKICQIILAKKKKRENKTAFFLKRRLTPFLVGFKTYTVKRVKFSRFFSLFCRFFFSKFFFFHPKNKRYFSKFLEILVKNNKIDGFFTENP